MLADLTFLLEGVKCVLAQYLFYGGVKYYAF